MTPIESSGVSSNLATDFDASNTASNAAKQQQSDSEARELHSAFVAKNVMLLQSLNAGDKLIDVCRYIYLNERDRS